jgi:serine/threonine-protein kinase
MASPDSTPSLGPGSVVLGKLRIVRAIGSGGMGVVYEVEHELTKHRRALKILHARVAQQPGILERFLREASAAGRIGSPHIAEAFDAGRLETGEPYLLMELVDGETLDQRVQRLGPLSAGELADLIHQACQGVQAAHDAGIVHRDLKPENLIVTTRDGAPFVKILDFGISKFDTDRTGAMGITTDGLLMGTPYYMSPEQVRSMPIDARTDVYALGVILYECSCGVRPFEARSVEVLAVLIHQGKTVPLSERRPGLPPVFCAIVQRAMSLEREHRFESALALADALAPLRVRTLHAPVHSSAPPRAVVRPSARPPAGETAVSAVVPSTDAALAATMGSGPVSVARASSGLRVALIAALVAVGAAVAIAAALFLRSPSPAPAASAAAGEPAPRETASAVLAPLAPLESAAPPPSEAPHPAVSAPPAPSRPVPSPPPPAASVPKSRVDQTGLAGENPFK